MSAASVVFSGAASVVDPDRLVAGPYGSVSRSDSAVVADGKQIAWKSPAGNWCTRFTQLMEDARRRRWLGSEQTSEIMGFVDCWVVG